MDNFTYWNPVKIVFGRETIEELRALVPFDANIMLVYGGGSIKKNNVYDRIKESLGNKITAEFSGIEPNPHYETCLKAVDLIKEKNIDYILAAGGGSVIDSVKFIAAAAVFEGADPWQILVSGGEIINNALPFGCVITLPATGSEMNPNSVISRAATKEKLHFKSPFVYPVFSIMDPETTFTLPPRQTANGIADTFVHVMEQYMTRVNNAPLQDRQAEAVLSTLIEEAPRVLETPGDYDVRANLMWCATNGLNGLLACGQAEDWSTHMIGHELTAFYGIDHARSLAIVLPSLWRYRKKEKFDKLLQYARRIFNIETEDESVAVDQAINKTEEFFYSLGIPTSLSEYGIDSIEAAEKIRERFKARDSAFGEGMDIDADAAYCVLKGCG
jgi:NADP-dependent alcohol dehydrogenase